MDHGLGLSPRLNDTATRGYPTSDRLLRRSASAAVYPERRDCRWPPGRVRVLPKPVMLTAEEAADWNEVTSRIRLEIAQQKADAAGRKPLTERAKLLLIQRSRIAKKAFNKMALSERGAGRAFEQGSRWLVYCEDVDQLRDVMRSCGHWLEARRVSQLNGRRSGRPSAGSGRLAEFSCPSSVWTREWTFRLSRTPLILASSQNPRQFIQRRGAC